MADSGLSKDKMARDIAHIFIVANVLNVVSLCVATLESQGQAFIQTDNELRYMVDGHIDGVPSDVIPGSNIQDRWDGRHALVAGLLWTLVSLLCHTNNPLDVTLVSMSQDGYNQYHTCWCPGDECRQGTNSIHDGGTRPGNIRFDPPILDFREKPVGMPYMEQVTVHNPDTQNSLHLLSISGSTLHFHCSFFQDKMVPPGGNTTFDVVFLARQEGYVENTLYIHTSQGSYKYQVLGIGTANPYRIRPFIGAKVPLNSSFSPLIRMHNPHSSTLQVIEMYSSGGDLHLELPTGEKEAPRNLWEIPPFETKPVMRASFVGRIESNHTAFIRIKTNREDKDEILVLPVEVEVSSAPGLFSPLEMLDFGILRTLDAPKTIRLNLLNSGTKPVHITSISQDGDVPSPKSISAYPPNEAISIDFRRTKLQPDVIQTTPVAMISFSAAKAVHPRQWTGKIVVKTKAGMYKVSIPYQAAVLHGSLVYDQNQTFFYTGVSPTANVSREITLTNTFNFTLVIHNTSLPNDVSQYFTVNLTKPVMLGPEQRMVVFTLRFHPTTPNLHFTSELRVSTNASIFNIPIIVYNGRLKVVHHRPEIFKGQLDFGTMGVEERRNMTFTLRNDNPIDIVIQEFGANMERIHVELLGVERGNGTTLTRKHNVSEVDKSPLVLKPYHFAVFSVNLVAPNMEGTFAAEVIIVTQFENLYIPITLRTAEGSLKADMEKINFEACFPSKICSQELKINSTFDHYMEIRELTFQPKDPRFYYEPASDTPIQLEPHSQTSIGKIYFDAKRDCKADCFLGLPTSIPAGHQWLLGASLDKEVADTDQYLYTRFQQKWDLLGHQQLSTINVTIQLDTNQVRGFLFPAQAHLHWPSLVRRCRIRFPLTQIGNLSISDFIVENPSNVPVLMQLLPLPLYPNPQTIVDLLNPRYPTDLNDYIEMDDLEIFTLRDLEVHSPNPSNPVPGLRRNVETTLGVTPHDQTITMWVGDGAKIRVRVGFQPKDDLPRTSLIVIRNNLTIIDALVLQGQGGRGEMRFSNRKPGSQTPLQFEITADRHLKACEKRKNSKTSTPNFTMRRTFTARNPGQLPFYVHGFSINDSPCEGYGFRVLECEGFELQPNSSRKIDIAFTPDFTMSRMRRTLSVYTSLGPPANYTLQATVPAHMLTKCAAALPRPPWEPILYYVSVCCMVFVLCGVLVFAYVDADKVFTTDIIKRRSKMNSVSSFDRSKVFDLKTIAGVKQPPSPSVITKTSPPKLSASSHTEMSNGHIAVTKKPAPSFSFLSFVRQVFSWRPYRHISASNPAPENEVPVSEKTPPTPPVANGNNNVKHNEKPQTVEATVERPPLLLKLPNKRNKAAKRQHVDINNTMDVHDRKYNQDARGRRQEAANEKEAPRPTNTKKNDRIISNDLSDITELTLLTEDHEDNIKNAKRLKQRRSRGSSKTDILFEQRLKDKLRSQDFDNDKDETSSTTTTDSSSAEPEDKTSSARDSTPEPVSQPSKKKTRSKKDKKSQNVTEDGPDEEFLLTSKCKAQKKIRVDPKNAYGGNILCPSSLELPYKTKLEADRDLEQSSDISEKPKKSTKVATRSATKPKGERSGGLSLIDLKNTNAESRDWSAPTHCPWDTPRTEGDLSELASATELFAQKLGKTSGRAADKTGAAHSIPPTSDGTGRTGSYSSVVSNGGTGPASDTARKAGKLGDLSKNPNMFPMTSEGGLGGNISPISPSGGLSQNPWTGEQLSPDSMSSATSFLLQPIQETQPPMTMADDDLPRPFPPISAAGAFGLPDAVGHFPIGSGLSDLNNMTMMQKLQADRRKRLIDYQQKLMKSDEWPGFNILPQTQTESLWDSTQNAQTEPTWSTLTNSPPRPQAAAMLWDTPLNQATAAGWNSATGLWADAGLDAGASGAGPEQLTPPPPGGAVGSFDPFNTLGSIWKPGGGNGGSAPGGWGFLPKPDPEDN